MRKKILSVSILFLFLCLFSVILVSCVSPGSIYLESSKKNAELMLPDLISYIENDEKLSDLDKEVRIKSVKTWLELIREMEEKGKEQ